MKRLLTLVALAVATVATGEATRIAAHPLEVRELTVEQRDALKAFFDVRLARTPGVQLAGSARIDEALRSPKAKDCELKDGCLRHLATATDSRYAVYARLRREPEAGELLLTARVVRSDGTVVKVVSLRAYPTKNVELIETCRALVSRGVAGLKLASLAAAGATAPVLEALPPPPLVAARTTTPGLSTRQTAGLVIAGVGLATLASGGMLMALAIDGRSRLAPDTASRTKAERANTIATQSNAGAVLIPVGVVVGLSGALLALWPDERRVRLAVDASPTGGGFVFAGSFP